MTEGVLLTLQDVTIERGGLPLASGISFSLKPGEVIVLRGPNGSGKTTLLRTIAGLQPVARGEIDVDPDAVVYGAHSDGVKGTLSVAENLSFWASIYGYRDILPAIRAFDLEALTSRPAAMLSAGQKRRLGLARLVVTQRPVWVLDEPTVSLDADSVSLFAAAVEAHIGTGGAAIIATHIDLGLQADALNMSDFTAVREAASDPFDEAIT